MESCSKDSAVDLWRQLQRRTLHYFDSQQPRWKYPINLDATKDAECEKWISECHRHSEKVRDIVRLRLTSDILTIEDEELLYFVSVRFAAACSLLSQMVYESADGWKVVALPLSLDGDLVLDSLLLDWWDAVGIHVAFDHVWRGTMFYDME